MQGLIGLIINENTIVNSVKVLGPAGTDAWLVRFQNAPVFQKIISVNEMSTWLLFQNDKELQAFVKEHEAPGEGELTPPPGPTPPEDPPADPPPPEDPDGITH